ncbi:RHS repeat-associated core domain-containing protein [Synechococcus sp. PCC 7336]|uniref:RHS repeat-associated core domain-containing protein n=1 Tax=Synechococcus sp. PCC 7336 TaxID=195250 RepID=UPI0003450DBB|nr:RHS repeat-associated core domain-containing protein [Synechococcus sp. PCC 7336]
MISLGDRNNNRTEFRYDELDRLIEQIDADSNSALFEYDKLGNLVRQTNRRGFSFELEYDARNRLVRTTDALNGQISYAYDGASNLLSETDELDRTTQFRYDALNRQVEILDPLLQSTQFRYDLVGNLVGVDGELNRTVEYAYDELNRLTTITNALDDAIAYGYDSNGNLTSITDELARTITFTYDARNFQTSVIDPFENSITTAYDSIGNAVSVTDALGDTTVSTYDELNRLLSTTDANGDEATYTYDAEGNLTSLLDPAGNLTTYQYDRLNRLVLETNQLGDSRSFDYDEVGNLVGRTDRNNRRTVYIYDPLNRLTNEQFLGDSGAIERSFTYTYDAASQLRAAGDALYTYSYDYDLAGRLTSVSNVGSVGAPEVTLDYTYDRQNNLTSVTDTINGVEAGIEIFEYDLLDRVTRITQSGTGVSEKAVTFAYDAASQLTQLDSFSDLAQTQLVASSLYSYDLAGRLEQISQSNDGGAIAEYRYQYDAANRITQLVSPDGVSNFTYDARDQLTSAEHGFQTDEAYSYDANGNRTNVGYLTGPNNQLLEDEQYRYDYDGEGNRIRQTEKVTGEVTEYDWDHRNQLRAVATRDSNGNTILSAEYDYDVFGRRILRTVDSDGDGALAAETERFVYDGEHIALVFDGEGNLTYRYLHGLSIDRVLAQEDSEGTVLFSLTDHLGTVRDLLAADGNVVNHLSYGSFGNITGQTNPNIEFRFAYTGREFDGETGLYYYRARYYDPSAGQFISQDPLSFGAGDANLYRYVFNSPLAFTDPSGQIIVTALVTAIVVSIATELILPDAIPDGTDVQQSRDLERAALEATIETGAALFTGNVAPLGETLFSATVEALTRESSEQLAFAVVQGSAREALENAAESAARSGADTILNPRNLTAADNVGRAALERFQAINPSAPFLSSVDNVNPSTPVGRRGGDPTRGGPIQVPPPANTRTTIGNREFSGHTLDRMQEQGLVPSVVEDAIQNGQRSAGRDGTDLFFSPENNVTVVVDNATGSVITADFGNFVR